MISQELEAAADRPGDPRDTFRAIDTLLLIGAFGGVLVVVVAIGVAIAVVWLLIKGVFDVRLLQAGFVPLGILFGFATARECWRRMRSRVLLHERGFFLQLRDDFSIFPWEKITRVIYDDTSAKPGPSGFPRVRRATAFTVFREDGATFTFSLYSFRRHLKLARAIFDATKPLGVQWKPEE
jgi:hypothetical protein